ncbi:G-protein alpha subunit-domain-containing protein [Pisolithus microcarpus]|nr:G-protein alpha subunit-domain-containing protein [Pisolithus microcarpus]
MTMMMPLEPNRRRSLSDPLSAALKPPENETPADRDRRLLAEQEAKQVSDRIDEMLREEKKEKRSKPAVKVLLLGQSESGKSTTLKQYWTPFLRMQDPLDDGHGVDLWPVASNRTTGTRVAKYEHYRRALEPLRGLEEHLIRMLSAPDEVEPVRIAPSKPDWNLHNITTSPPSSASRGRRPSPVITIPHLPKTKAFSLANRIKSTKSAHTNEIEGWWDDPSDPVPPMSSLWKDPNVKQRLRELKLRIEESSGFFLDEISRITALRYFPTDQDVLKARLKTLGVVEHSFSIPDCHRRTIEWKIYDVGGARNQRSAWAPYFDDGRSSPQTLTFLFDQVLAEDSRVNRLEDSFLLWKSLVSNKLLTDVSIILFLNKIDLLQAKLRSGVRLRDHMPHYGDRPNDYDNVSKYFYNKFGALHQEFSANRERELKIHFTSVTDTRRTAIIMKNVRDIIITTNLKSLRLM